MPRYKLSVDGYESRRYRIVLKDVDWFALDELARKAGQDAGWVMERFLYSGLRGPMPADLRRVLDMRGHIA